MKNLIKLAAAFIFSFILIGTVNAEGIVSNLKLECKSPVGYNTTFDCDLYGKVNDSKNLSNLEVNDITNSKMFKTMNVINYDVSRMSGTLKLATYTGKTYSTSGKATVALRVAYNDIYIQYVTYKIRINDNNTDLKSISVDDKAIPNFKGDKTSYSYTTKNNKISLKAVAKSNRTSISGLGDKKLECGVNNFEINTKAQSKDEKKYTVKITRDCDTSSEVVLKNVKISKGNITPKFDSKITDYKIIVKQDVDKISITGEVDKKLTLEGNVKDKQISPGANKFTLTVKGDNNIKKEYIFNVIRQKDDAYLSSLALSSGAFNFDRKTFMYETTVLYDTVNVDVRAVPEAENSKVVVEGGKDLKVGENEVSVKVTSETESSNTYKIKIVRLKEGETLGDNAYIKNIKIKNYNLDFDPNIVNYNLKIKNEKKLDITVTMEDENSVYEILGNSNLKDGSIITIKATSSGGFVKIYKIKISKKNHLFYYIGGLIILICIIGAIGTLIFMNRKKKIQKKSVLSSNLLSSFKDKINKASIDNKKTNVKPPMEKNSNTNRNIPNNKNMKICPKCGFKVPNNITTCPRCGLKLK